MKSSRLAKLQRRKRKIIFLIISLISVIAGGYYFIFLSSFFHIQQIIFIPQNKFLQRTLDSYLLTKFHRYVPSILIELFPQFKNNYRNILLLNNSELKSLILKKYLILKSVNISKDIPNRKVIIRSQQRKPQYLLCYLQSSENQEEQSIKERKKICFYLDSEGIIYSEAPNDTNVSLNKIILKTTEKVFLGEKILAARFWHTISTIFTLTQAENSPIKVSYLEFPRKNPSWINIVTKDGWSLKINLNDDFSFLLQVVKQFQQQKSPYVLHSLKYLDLRFLPHIYYSLY